jgi:hypothetical protein
MSPAELRDYIRTAPIAEVQRLAQQSGYGTGRKKIF